MSGLLAALGLSVLLVADAERRMAAHASYAWTTMAAADGALERVLAELRATADWSACLDGMQRSAFTEGGPDVALPAGGTLNLDAVTAALQAQTQSMATFGADTPVWQLFAWGALSRLAAPGEIDSLQYIVVWIADDPSDADGNPRVDSNGILVVRAEARGPAGARRARQATIARAGPDAVRVISWREVP